MRLACLALGLTVLCVASTTAAPVASAPVYLESDADAASGDKDNNKGCEDCYLNRFRTMSMKDQAAKMKAGFGKVTLGSIATNLLCMGLGTGLCFFGYKLLGAWHRFTNIHTRNRTPRMPRNSLIPSDIFGSMAVQFRRNAGHLKLRRGLYRVLLSDLGDNDADREVQLLGARGGTACRRAWGVLHGPVP